MRVIVEQFVEWRLAGETEVLGSNPGRRGGKPATNRLSYGAVPRLNVTTYTQWVF
jgi:hypothetical protein